MLKLIEVTAGYGNIDAIKKLSIELKKGEILTILGANGAGKTTTLLTISGAVKAKNGEILLEDNKITALPAHEISKLGIAHVPEGRRIFSRLTVEENLKMGAFLRQGKSVKQSMDHVFEYFPILRERRTQLGGTLSGGEQQMLAIARGLMQKPSILLLDEPSLGLAPKIEQLIFNIIRKINSEGITILLVEQNAHLALKIAHRAYVLETGRLVAEGAPEILFKNEQIKKAYLG